MVNKGLAAIEYFESKGRDVHSNWKTCVEVCVLPKNDLTARLFLNLLYLILDQKLGITGATGIYAEYLTQIIRNEGLTVRFDRSKTY